MAFPNAVIRASNLDADYWLNRANENAAPAFLRPMFEGDRVDAVSTNPAVRPPLNTLRGVFVSDHSLGLKAVLACP
jgi:hypothetical protein